MGRLDDGEGGHFALQEIDEEAIRDEKEEGGEDGEEHAGSADRQDGHQGGWCTITNHWAKPPVEVVENGVIQA